MESCCCDWRQSVAGVDNNNNNNLCCDDSDAIYSSCADDGRGIDSSAESAGKKFDCRRRDQEQLFHYVNLYVRDELLRLYDRRTSH